MRGGHGRTLSDVTVEMAMLRGKTATYLTVLGTDGSVILEDTHVADVKYEGIEVAV